VEPHRDSGQGYAGNLPAESLNLDDELRRGYVECKEYLIDTDDQLPTLFASRCRIMQDPICLLECLRFDCRGILQRNPFAGFLLLKMAF